MPHPPPRESTHHQEVARQYEAKLRKDGVRFQVRLSRTPEAGTATAALSQPFQPSHPYSAKISFVSGVAQILLSEAEAEAEAPRYSARIGWEGGSVKVSLHQR